MEASFLQAVKGSNCSAAFMFYRMRLNGLRYYTGQHLVEMAILIGYVL